MQVTRLDEAFLTDVDRRLADTDAELATRYPDNASGRQPVHTVYVPADRFGQDTVRQWSAEASDTLARHAATPHAFGTATGLANDGVADVYSRMVAKLDREPIEDLRLDFEDGYGTRDDDEEDATAGTTATVLGALEANGGGPAFCGVRIKSLEAPTRRRGLRTLDAFLGALVARGTLPDGFVVTLPKVSAVAQVDAMTLVCARLETAYGLAERALRFELQIETSQAICGPTGLATVAGMIGAAEGRCTGLHYGTYDYSAACGIAAAYQSMDHPAADHAKAVMQVAAAQTGVRLSDGSTNILPVGDRAAVHAAWRLHARLVRRSLERGFYQGWDLHPAQLPTRYAATYAFFREGFAAAADRLRAYADRATAGVLDEPATAQALAGYLVRGLDCGALDETEVRDGTGLDRAALDQYARRVS